MTIILKSNRVKGLPVGLSDKKSACSAGVSGFDPWVGKIPWRRKWQPAPAFLPGKPHGQRSPQSRGSQESWTWLSACAHTHTRTRTRTRTHTRVKRAWTWTMSRTDSTLASPDHFVKSTSKLLSLPLFFVCFLLECSCFTKQASFKSLFQLSSSYSVS